MILMNDFQAEPVEIRAAMLEATARVLDSGRYVLGGEVEAFERQWAALCGVSCGVGVGNGMDAIEIALRALDIGPGAEVVVPAMTAFATVLAVMRAGAEPVLADIERESALLSLDSAQRCLSSRTRAVLLVHLYGQLRNMQLWVDFCAEHGIALVEDCAQAHMASWQQRVAGSFGLAGAYSFYPTKNLGASGDGGMLVSNDESIAERARRLRNYGQSTRHEHPELGMNSRLDEIQAAILSRRLKWLTAFTRRRREIAESYRAQLNNPAVELLGAAQEFDAHVYHLFVVTCEERDQLQAHLQSCSVQTSIHYPVAIHCEKPCAGLARDRKGLANSERHARTCLSLPCHPQMTEGQVDAVVAAVNCFAGRRD
jgi:dTDP-4-amino-4,6-dideoxygalactose transaminase